jgi:predicted acyl esterase
MQQALLPAPPTLRDPDGDWVDVWEDHLEELESGTPFLFQFLDYESLDEYWAGKDIPVEDIVTPTLAVSGWRDYFPATTLEYFEEILAPKRMLLGPWRHEMPHRDRESAIDFRQQVVEWFDHFLKDEDNGALDHDRIEYWTERDGGGKVDGGLWRGRGAWPTAEDGSLTFALTSDGLRERDEYDAGELERVYEPDHTVGVESTALDVAPPVDTNADDARSMTFETGPLDGPVELTGTGEATVRVTPTTSDPSVVVRVVDVSPDGTATLVTHGELGHGDFRTNEVDSRTTPESLTPSETYELTLPLKPKSHVFEEGHRIRVAVSAAYFPLMLPSRHHGELTIHSTPDRPSSVTLPGRRLDCVDLDDEEIPMSSPDRALSTEPELLTNQSSAWDVTRHNMDDGVTVTVTGEHDAELPNVGATLTYRRRIETTVDAGDPSTAIADCRQELVVDDGRRTIRSVGTTQTTRDTGYASTTVSINGETAFERTWRR